MLQNDFSLHERRYYLKDINNTSYIIEKFWVNNTSYIIEKFWVNMFICVSFSAKKFTAIFYSSIKQKLRLPENWGRTRDIE